MRRSIVRRLRASSDASVSSETEQTEERSEHHSPRRGPTRRAALLVAGLVVVLAWALDQLTKSWVVAHMELGERIDALPPVLYWQYHLNPGAAFSLGTDHTWLFTLIMVVVLGYVLWRARELGGSWRWAIALGGLAGGVTGNLTDRLFRPPGFGVGEVVDFIAVPRFAIFNVADSFIVCSMIGICLLLVTGLQLDGSRATAEPRGDEAEQDHAERHDPERDDPKRAETGPEEQNEPQDEVR